MPLLLIPYGKGSGKYWFLGIIIVSIICFIYIGYEGLVEQINAEQITNPLIILLVQIFYPLYVALIWLLSFICQWGILAVIPIIIVLVIGFTVFDKIMQIKNKGRVK